MQAIYKLFNAILFCCIFVLLFSISSCKKFVEIDPPVTSTNAENVYTSDATAIAVLTGVYNKISSDNSLGLATTSSITGISVFSALSADELTLYNLNSQFLPFYFKNDLSITTTGGVFWNSIYPIIFTCNSAIDGLNASVGLTPAVKQQLLGEAKFVRAFCYFYLANLYGDIPLALSTDYKINASLSRAPIAQVYNQVIQDLKDAQGLLSVNYLDASLLKTTIEKVRPTQSAAAALLARVYLYVGDSVNADTQASAVINNPGLFSLDTLNGVFVKNSKETIWSLQPVNNGARSNTGEGALFILPSAGPNTGNNPVYLSSNVVNAFDSGDQRRANWVQDVIVGNDTFYYPYKYKIGLVNVATNEYIMMLRLAEQYLIRAEARAKRGNLSGAAADLNTIRNRAGLPDTTAISKADLLTAIYHERQVELFTEWGHRWFDLKRTGAIGAIMNVVSPQKGGSWSSYKALYPIPQTEINADPNLSQNAGY